MLTLEISHEGLGSRVQSVDDHLSISWSGDLNPDTCQLSVSRNG